MKPVYVTGNLQKAKRFSYMLGLDIDSVAIDLVELQSLDVRLIVEHKAREAYAKVKKPVIVEDTTLQFNALGALPGPLIKWFLEELKPEGLCRLLDGKVRSAIAGSAIAYYDGASLEVFYKDAKGFISEHPRGSGGWGWDSVFVIGDGNKTNAEITELEYEQMYRSVKTFEELKAYLQKLDKV